MAGFIDEKDHQQTHILHSSEDPVYIPVPSLVSGTCTPHAPSFVSTEPVCHLGTTRRARPWRRFTGPGIEHVQRVSTEGLRVAWRRTSSMAGRVVPWERNRTPNFWGAQLGCASRTRKTHHLTLRIHCHPLRRPDRARLAGAYINIFPAHLLRRIC